MDCTICVAKKKKKDADQLHGYHAADQLQGYHAADLRLCFCICLKQVFS